MGFKYDKGKAGKGTRKHPHDALTGKDRTKARPKPRGGKKRKGKGR
jgi:hypothetical protein